MAGVGLPVVPKRAQALQEAMLQRGLPVLQMLAYEKETNRRIVAETEHFLALTPYAGRFAYELWLAPKAHQRDFGEMSAEERQELAALLRKMLGRVTGIREDIGYNICVMDGPRDTDFHWHIEILPRIGRLCRV